MYEVYGRKKITVPPLLSKYMLDFLCVAAHYATQYSSSDHFLEICNDTRLVEHSLFLTKNTPESMVDTFIEKSLTPCAAASTIDSKNIIFLWKKFLEELSIPNIIFYDALKTQLKNKLNYDEVTDCFIGVTSIHLPLVSQFLKFWEANMTESVDEMDELAIEQICALFKTGINTTKPITDALIVELLQHFYPEVVIENGKTILNMKTK
jgi:hypothetical protein